MAPQIAHVVNCSLDKGAFPDKTKIARILPIYKEKGDRQEFGNYRPISLLPVFSKILEKLIYKKIFEFLTRCQILFKSQYGFRKGHNTTHATLDFLKTVEQALMQNEYAIGIFCDLSKAFDTLDHQILLHKLEHYGIRGKMLSWIKSYLSDRKQFVDLDGIHSEQEDMSVGVPQGSILGPLLFLVYINDLPAALERAISVVFADDSNIVIQGKELPDLVRTLNAELETLGDYFKSNKLKLNVDKTKMVCFCRSGKDTGDLGMVRMDGKPIGQEDSTKYLGITIDKSLTWEKHCNNVANKMARNAGILNRVKNILPIPSMQTLYNSLIFPHFSYGLETWGTCNKKFLKRIITIQKKAVRSISKSHWLSHTEPRMRKYNILNITDQHHLQCMSLTYDMLKGSNPDIYDLLNSQIGQRHISLRSTTERPQDLRVSIPANTHSPKKFPLLHSTALEQSTTRNKKCQLTKDL